MGLRALKKDGASAFGWAQLSYNTPFRIQRGVARGGSSLNLLKLEQKFERGHRSDLLYQRMGK